MTVFDYAIATVVLLSVLVGWWRGLVYEAVTLLSWVGAYTAARLFAVDVMPYLPQVLGTDVARMAVAFALLFMVTLVIGGILAWALSKLVKSPELTRLDGSMGALFGLLRGLVLVLALVLLAGMTELPKTPFWRDAWTSSALESIAIQVRVWLPEGLAQKIQFN